MDLKNVMAQTNNFTNHIITHGLSTEIVELLEEDLQQIVGGNLISVNVNLLGSSGSFGASVSQSLNTQNSVQIVVTDAQSIDVVTNFDVLEDPLVIV